MKASEAGLLTFLKKSSQFVIPIYQRTYSWTSRECEQLWKDIIRSGASDNVSGHFIGSVVYIEQQLSQVSNQSPLLVIDGQQRLTTVTLILEALARELGTAEFVLGFSARKVRNYYLVNPEESGIQHFKLELTQTDRDTLFAIVQQRPLPTEQSLRMRENFDYFSRQIRELDGDFVALANGLSKLVIVDVALKSGEDNPQLIFESMNSTGRELSQADLIRNYVLMGLEANQQNVLYADHWRPMEVAFGQAAYGQHFDSFMRHYLTYRTGEIPNINAVYEAFKAYSRTTLVQQSGVSALVADIHAFAEYYVAMALGRESNKQLAAAFQDLRELRVDVAYPFLLQLYDDFHRGALPLDTFVKLLRLIESYVFRRAVCSIPTNTLNKTFAGLGRMISKDRYLESVQAHLLGLTTYRRFPEDAEFEQHIQVRDVYNFRIRSYLLRRLENEGRKEPVSIDEYTIEHIMPQNEKLSAQWRASLGPGWQQVQQTLLHSLGNLTLTGYNSEYGDRPFTKKRDIEGGFRDSPLHLNRGLGTLDDWNEGTIRDRAGRLAKIATRVWSAPKLSASVLDTYQEAPLKAGGYRLEDHQYLRTGSAMRPLFDDLSREISALDPGITREILKLYVAFKAETNFVDVVPQAGALRLSLNMEFNDIVDPHGICVDVTNLGQWGNGDIQVRLKTLDELPYVMGLIRQSLERQLGNTAEL